MSTFGQRIDVGKTTDIAVAPATVEDAMVALGLQDLPEVMQWNRVRSLAAANKIPAGLLPVLIADPRSKLDEGPVPELPSS